ncbi:hypothetical protein [uncultured Maribacter sp.]|uniref:hypothetical protein n=1 Tax=uncultured Maribacter sp. TaxID=431308 RepID=UPI00260C7F3C|nr:hypothetical protein [uncultured Maribacter sp.]
MLSEENYGKPINEKLSIVLRRNTTKDDYADIASKTNISFSTIRDVVHRTNSVTKSNSKAILFLIIRAFDNSLGRQLQAEGDKLFLNKIIKINESLFIDNHK